MTSRADYRYPHQSSPACFFRFGLLAEPGGMISVFFVGIVRWEGTFLCTQGRICHTKHVSADTEVGVRYFDGFGGSRKGQFGTSRRVNPKSVSLLRTPFRLLIFWRNFVTKNSIDGWLFRQMLHQKSQRRPTQNRPQLSDPRPSAMAPGRRLFGS